MWCNHFFHSHYVHSDMIWYCILLGRARNRNRLMKVSSLVYKYCTKYFSVSTSFSRERSRKAKNYENTAVLSPEWYQIRLGPLSFHSFIQAGCGKKREMSTSPVTSRSIQISSDDYIPLLFTSASVFHCATIATYIPTTPSSPVIVQFFITYVFKVCIIGIGTKPERRRTYC